MNFANGQILWLLLVIPPAVAAFFWWSWRKKQALMTQFIAARLLPGLTVGISPTRQKVRFACVVGAAALLVVALARPQWGYHYEEVHQRGLDIVVAIDTSKSMLATDVQPDRLSRAKFAALDLMQQAKSDRLGLVAFAGEAFLRCPLTIDDTAFRQSVESLDVNAISQGGTDIGGAIHTALTAFKEQDNFKVLVLFTDGEDNDAGALPAAQAAAKEGLKIFTVGIGTPKGELLRIPDGKGGSEYIRDEQGNVHMSKLNESLLQQIAGATDGGFYLPLTSKTIDTLYAQGLAPLPKSGESTRLLRQYHERYHWPLGLAIVLLLVEMLLPERRSAFWRDSERPQKRAESALGGPVTTAFLILFLLPTVVKASPAKAMNEYNSGEFDKALKEYQQALQKKKDDPRLNYNAGAAAYREDKFDQAGKYFDKSISAENIKLQERGYYNMGNVLYRVGERLEDKDKKKEAWRTALTNYDRTLKLNAADEDARFNYEFVKRKIEELEQEQQQQQGGGGGGDKDQKQNDQKQQGQGDQNQQQQQNQQQGQGQQNQQQQQQKQDQKQSGNSGQQQQQQKPQDSSGQQKKDEQQQGQQQQQPQQAGQQGQEQQVRAMSPEEAKRMLDAQQGDEQLLQFGQGEPKEDQERPYKDW
jgi:Ca-activated chloride channel homolog